ncbi:MAG: hypothetical protein IT431_00170 [Phycisphaerales bacterium]|nr:hypothetical protein [Phycisphaerales bacterium]
MANTDPSSLLAELEVLRNSYGAGEAGRKLAILDALEHRRLPTGAEVRQLHERLCFLRAYPDSPEVLAAVERLLGGFGARGDLGRHRAELADSGIAGTVLYFRFFWLTARWLVARWPEALSIDWKELGKGEGIEKILHLLMPWSETPGLDSFAFSAREWVDRLKGDAETDASFVIHRFAAMEMGEQAREHLYEEIDIPMALSPGPTTPARTRERWAGSPVVFRTRPLDRSRPDLKREVRALSPRVRAVGEREGEKLIELANACMVPRHRDLLAFLNADARDVRMVGFGDGLEFAVVGTAPERRLMLEAVYAALTLHNGVPIGYVLFSAFFGSAEVAYNTFETFRGAEAARNYARVLAMVRVLLGAESFAVDPYQLGHNNAEGQESGAWWFYYKLGFRARDGAVRRLAREEALKVRADRRYRTSRSTLNELASAYMFLQLGRARRDVLGEISLGNIGLHISRALADRGGSDREGALDWCSEEAAEMLGVRSVRGWSAGERLSWRRWSPLVVALPGVRRWSAAQRRALRDVARAKGGRRESDFVRLFDAHAALRRAVLELAAEEV